MSKREGWNGNWADRDERQRPIEDEAGVSVAPELDWHDVGCVKRYGAVGEGGAMCACQQRRAPRTGAPHE